MASSQRQRRETALPKRPTKRKAANGTGSVYPFKNRFRGALTSFDGSGKRTRHYVVADTEDEARLALDALRLRLRTGKNPPKAQTVGEWLTVWLAMQRQRTDEIRPATYRRYEGIVRVHIIPALGTRLLRDLLPMDIQQLTASLAGAGKVRTAAQVRVYLRMALADAVRNKVVEENVAAQVRAPKTKRRTLVAGRDYLAPADLKHLFTVARLHPIGPMIEVAAGLGLRLGELTGLEWGDVDLDARTLTVRRSQSRSWEKGAWTMAAPKTERSQRTVSLPAFVVAALERQRAFQDAAREAAGRTWQGRRGAVFTMSHGHDRDHRNTNKEWHRLLEVAGLPSLPFHALRHSAATAMLAGGVPLKVVSETLGHASVAMTADTYSGVLPAQRQEAAAAMDRMLA